jgi:hypothetical protein
MYKKKILAEKSYKGEPPVAALPSPPPPPPVAAEAAPPAAAPAPPPPPAGTDIDLTRLKNSLPLGEIAYAPDRDMTQGVETTVTARVGRGKLPDLKKGFPKEEGKVEVESIPVTMKMTAKLEYDEAEFKVIPREAVEKVLLEMVEWTWRVTPLKTGTRHLNLRLTGQLKLPDGSEGPLDVPVKEATITVRVNAPYLIKEFVAQNWQWIIGGPVGLLVIGTALRGLFGKKKT